MVGGGAVMTMVLTAAAVVGAYVLGSIPTGLLLARGVGVDIRAVGSGNIGATNVARTLWRRRGAVVLVLDALKGAVPVLVAAPLARAPGGGAVVIAAVGLAAIGGHCFSMWLGFRGGKGVATSLGVFAVVAPVATGIAAVLFLAIYVVFRVASLGSITAAAAMPALMLALGCDRTLLAMAIPVALLIVVKHRANIARLLRHEENRV